MVEPSDARPCGAAHIIGLGAAWTAETGGGQVAMLRRFGCPSGLTVRHRVTLVLEGRGLLRRVTLNQRVLPPQQNRSIEALGRGSLPVREPIGSCGTGSCDTTVLFDLTGRLLRRNELRVEWQRAHEADAPDSGGPPERGLRSLPLAIGGLLLEDAWLEIAES